MAGGINASAAVCFPPRWASAPVVRGPVKKAQQGRELFTPGYYWSDGDYRWNAVLLFSRLTEASSTPRGRGRGDRRLAGDVDFLRGRPHGRPGIGRPPRPFAAPSPGRGRGPGRAAWTRSRAPRSPRRRTLRANGHERERGRPRAQPASGTRSEAASRLAGAEERCERKLEPGQQGSLEQSPFVVLEDLRGTKP